MSAIWYYPPHINSTQTFIDAAIAVAELQFEDCTPPPADVFASVFTLAEMLPGALAVQREAMGWLAG